MVNEDRDWRAERKVSRLLLRSKGRMRREFTRPIKVRKGEKEETTKFIK